MSPEIEVASKAFMRTANRLPTLFDLTDEWNGLLAMLEDEDASVEEVMVELERVAGDIRLKAHGVAAICHTLQRMAELQKAERDRFARKAKANEAHAERIRQYALLCMQTLEEKRIETGAFTLARTLNNPAVTVIDEQQLVADFWRLPPPEVDKVKILQHWRATGEIPAGVEISRKERLDIR